MLYYYTLILCTFQVLGMFFSYLWYTVKKNFSRGEVSMATNLKLEEINLEEKYGAETILEPSEFLVKMNFLRVWFNNRFCKWFACKKWIK